VTGDVNTVRAAGGLVWRTVHGERQLLAVHRRLYDDWSLPKGKLEGDETEAQAALREVAEEASVTCSLGADLGRVAYTDDRGRPKTVRFWQMQVRSGTPAPANEVDDLRWIAFDAAAASLSYPLEREVLRRFRPPPSRGEPVTVHLVRHAKAGDRASWTEPDHLRPLDKAGRRQAEAIADELDALAAQPLVKLMSSPYLRCLQTLEPLGTRRDLAIETSDALAESADPRAAMALLAEEARAGSLAASTHGDILMIGVEALLGRGLRLRGEAVAFKKGCRWELTVVDGAYARARYQPPPSKGKQAD
jgi:phosphohistidine phosphatase SixA/8-oxo-dGTP pyrophosphatase MutT (NUDIX family)